MLTSTDGGRQKSSHLQQFLFSPGFIFITPSSLPLSLFRFLLDLSVLHSSYTRARGKRHGDSSLTASSTPRATNTSSSTSSFSCSWLSHWRCPTGGRGLGRCTYWQFWLLPSPPPCSSLEPSLLVRQVESMLSQRLTLPQSCLTGARTELQNVKYPIQLLTPD